MLVFSSTVLPAPFLYCWAHLSPKTYGISISSTIFAGLTNVTDRWTDRPRYWVSNNRPHIHT